MGKKEAVPNRQYTAEFRQEVVRLAESIGGNAAAKRLGVPQSTVTNWVRRARAGTLQDSSGEAVPVKADVGARGGDQSPAQGVAQYKARPRNHKKRFTAR